MRPLLVLLLVGACSPSTPVSTQCPDAGAALAECSARVSSCESSVTACLADLTDAGAQLATTVSSCSTCATERADAGAQLASCEVTVATVTGALGDAGSQLQACTVALTDAEGRFSACAPALFDAGTQLVTCGTALADAGTQLVTCGTALADAGTQLATCGTALADAGAQLVTCGTALTDAGTQLATCGTALADAGAKLATCTTALDICQGAQCGAAPAYQGGTEFWFAPPDVSDLHFVPGGEPLYLVVTPTNGLASSVTVDLPANGGFTPIVTNVPAGGTARITLTAFKAQLETRPTNTISNTGLRVRATTPISAEYIVANANNGEGFLLRESVGLGTQFYVPMHKHAPFANEASFAAPHQAIASFDIVATQNATTVSIYSPVAVDGHPANQQFSVMLNAGQAYSAGVSGTNWQLPSNHPSGAVVLADKPVAVTLKDDSVHNPSGGCADLVGTQLVPANAVGTDYVAVKGLLNNTGDESVVIVATRNDTKVFIDGAGPVATLFAGEYYRVDLDYLAASSSNSVYVHTTAPVYATHYSGSGCEMAMSLLPPLTCAGSSQVTLVRSDTQSYNLMVVAPTSSVSAFTFSGATAVLSAPSFVVVPGTGGVWSAARVQYNTTQFPVDTAITLSNSAAPFFVASLSGGATTSASYSWHSRFASPRPGQ